MPTNDLKGIILAGGLGSRLAPCTLVTNKHLLPIYDRPMIYYPITTLLNAEIRDILIVTGGHFAGDFLKLLKNGQHFGLKHLNYAYQEGEGGIADALSLAEHFVDKSRMCVILGDNIIQGDIRASKCSFMEQKEGGRVLLKEVEDAHRFGVAEVKCEKIFRIVEKPKNPKTRYAVTGIYFYDNQVFEIIKSLSPSERGELEITDVNNIYAERNCLEYDILQGWWTDAGTFESLARASRLVEEGGANNIDLKI